MPLHREAIKDCFMAMMERDVDTVEKELEKLVNRVKVLVEAGQDTTAYNAQLLLKLHEEFPGDVGGFAIYFLNIITLKPGQAMFLEANLPHAYLFGDCMECMACSDNVVRAGLTPKLRDVHTLCEMLDYTGRPTAKTLFNGVESVEDIKVTVFKPPVPDFSVIRYEIPETIREKKLAPIDSASICIVIQGQGSLTNHSITQPLPLKRGSVFFIGAMEEVELQVSSSFLLFRSLAGL
ncbi:hypothetical protein SNE40_001638 [Patella caerulea]|uniref:mannose-6-phosphate isomerase n=1 Tax=Patella caerulea TaxID=87958 RepID=A0AAN8Q385_PATCE